MPGTSGTSHMFPDADDTTSYMIELPTQDWEAWKDAIPRSTPLYERIHKLIQYDAGPNATINQESVNLLRMKYQRIHRRSITARDALDDDDLEKARRELEQIGEVAGEMVE